jgi:hypothetical protein
MYQVAKTTGLNLFLLALIIFGAMPAPVVSPFADHHWL